MYFYTICVEALLDYFSLPVSLSNIKVVSANLFVYGDDLIIPVETTDTILGYLQKYNCKVNTRKTFFGTSRNACFRESCGVDAFNGELVTPTYLRTLRPKNRQQSSEIISSVSTANQFYRKGYWRAATLTFGWVERLVGELPFVADDSPVIGRISFTGRLSVHRWNSLLHRFEVRGLTAEPIYRTGRLEGYAALSKSLRKLESLRSLDDPRDPLHLQRFARHGAVTLKRRWVPIT